MTLIHTGDSGLRHKIIHELSNFQIDYLFIRNRIQNMYYAIIEFTMT